MKPSGAHGFCLKPRGKAFLFLLHFVATTQVAISFPGPPASDFCLWGWARWRPLLRRCRGYVARSASASMLVGGAVRFAQDRRQRLMHFSEYHIPGRGAELTQPTGVPNDCFLSLWWEHQRARLKRTQ